MHLVVSATPSSKHYVRHLCFKYFTRKIVENKEETSTLSFNLQLLPIFGEHLYKTLLNENLVLNFKSGDLYLVFAILFSSQFQI